MSNELFSPVSDKLICLPVEQDIMSDGGIILPEVDDQKLLRAVVKFAGKGFWAAPGLFIETTMKPGDIILYQRFSAQTFEYKDEEYQVVQERDVITKINE